MKNLEQFGVQTLGTQETTTINGGEPGGGNDAEVNGCDGSEAHPFPLGEVVVVGHKSASQAAKDRGYDNDVVNLYKVLEWVADQLK